MLKKQRDRQLLFFIPPYIVLAGIVTYLWSSGVDSLNAGRSRYMRMEFSEDDAMRFRVVAPYAFSFFLLLGTIYFGRVFFLVILPIMKDIKSAGKSLVYYIPDKNPMPFFNKYYLSSPLYNKRQIQVSREDFESIPDNTEICLEIGAVSQTVLRLQYNNRDLKFY